MAGLAALLVAAPAAVAADTTAYRYWSFWTWDAAEAGWVYAAEGPGTARPADGALVGFRFGVGAEADDRRQPRGDAGFADICGAAPDGPSVALVLDFGTAADAPAGAEPPEPRAECLPLPDRATVAELLAEAAPPLRYDQAGLLCGIAGYPERGCGDEVGDGADQAAEGDEAGGGGSATVPLLVGAAGIGLLGLAGWARARRRAD
ncbi:SCO2322 family protein [Streptomyces sp. DSM 44915]|uniref:SCO2322 family protein n=1 Tax=Streptomyces chisholmiae TaxID=3075540 RepID=A0ABU2JP41_9ACTN|nr:SCO2322 family protein [Streptomyces sp. DSM 44915]MDT0266750.1 SCO2322 family protein [Streptomyces sp. DSM 44915]